MNIHNNPESYPVLDKGTVKNWEQKVRNIGRPTIFVGSSVESKPIAEKLTSCFPPEEFEVDIWYDGVFGATRSSNGDMSNMEWLKNFTDIYDFAIFIFVPEDQIVSSTRKDMKSNQPHKAQVTRHNVVFEFGMFLGKVGAKRSFILFDSEVRDFIDLFFTDLKENLEDEHGSKVNEQFRIELYSYTGNYQAYIDSNFTELPYEKESIEESVRKIQLQIKINFEAVDISFLPATTLAFGYYNNFIHFFVKNVNILKSAASYPEKWLEQEMNQADLDHFRRIVQESTSIKLKIVIPTSIEGTRQDTFIPDFDKNRFAHVKFPGSYRAITILSLANNRTAQNNEWVIYDVPTTLNSSIEAIEKLTPHPDIRELLKEKELRNFRKSIEYKIQKGKSDTCTANVEDIVCLISYDNFKEETQ